MVLLPTMEPTERSPAPVRSKPITAVGNGLRRPARPQRRRPAWRGRACGGSRAASRSRAVRWRRRSRPATGRSWPRRRGTRGVTSSWWSIPGDPGYEMVKRIVGMPGDSVGDRTLGDDEYWVEGDHEAASTDSRQFGPVRGEHLKARVLRRVLAAGSPPPGQVAALALARAAPATKSSHLACASRRSKSQTSSPGPPASRSRPGPPESRSSPDSPFTRSLPAVAPEPIVARTRDEQVAARPATGPVLPDRPLELVVARQPEEDVGPPAAAQLVLFGRADDVDRFAEASHQLVGAGVAAPVPRGAALVGPAAVAAGIDRGARRSQRHRGGRPAVGPERRAAAGPRGSRRSLGRTRSRAPGRRCRRRRARSPGAVRAALGLVVGDDRVADLDGGVPWPHARRPREPPRSRRS